MTGRFLDRNPGLGFVAEIGFQIVGCLMCGHDGGRGSSPTSSVASMTPGPRAANQWVAWIDHGD
jgi:hypothetical protein